MSVSVSAPAPAPLPEHGRPTLAAAILVYNGVATLGRCLDALQFCDEVVVVDDESTDGTWELLQARPGVRALRHRHTTFAAQRALARAQVRSDWLLTLDADEFVTPQLANAIRAALERPGVDGYYVRRRNVFPRGLSGHSWSHHPRLVRTAQCRWQPTDSPHAPLDTRGLRLRTLTGAHLEHEPLPDVATVMRKSVNRALILATQRRARHRRPPALRAFTSAAWRFAQSYFHYGCWRHGGDGLVMAGLMSLDAFFKYALGRSDVDCLAPRLDAGPGSYPVAAPIVDPATGADSALATGSAPR